MIYIVCAVILTGTTAHDSVRYLHAYANNIVKLLFSFCFKLSHYLDIVEVQIAQQVAQKSEAFFIAMTSHDALMEQLTHTINVVKALR